jgi:hypothetical protein
LIVDSKNNSLSTINYQLATGNWQLATGNYQLSTDNYQLSSRSRWSIVARLAGGTAVVELTVAVVTVAGEEAFSVAENAL